MIYDYNDPEVNRTLWLCADALGEVTTTSLMIIYEDEVDIANPNPFLLDC
jgi:hypothetical protein